MTVGILALQGAFAEHAAVLDRLVCRFEIRQKRDLEQPMDRLILRAARVPSCASCSANWICSNRSDSALRTACRYLARVQG